MKVYDILQIIIIKESNFFPQSYVKYISEYIEEGECSKLFMSKMFPSFFSYRSGKLKRFFSFIQLFDEFISHENFCCNIKF